MSWLDIGLQGGGAAGEFNSQAGQSLSINYNPIFDTGSGTLTSEPSGSASSSTTPIQTPSQTFEQAQRGSAGGGGYPAGAGYSTLGTLLPGAAGLPSSPLSSSTMVWLIIGAAALLLLMPSGGRHR